MELSLSAIPYRPNQPTCSWKFLVKSESLENSSKGEKLNAPLKTFKFFSLDSTSLTTNTLFFCRRVAKMSRERVKNDKIT